MLDTSRDTLFKRRYQEKLLYEAVQHSPTLQTQSSDLQLCRPSNVCCAETYVSLTSTRTRLPVTLTARAALDLLEAYRDGVQVHVLRQMRGGEESGNTPPPTAPAAPYRPCE